MNIPQTKIDSHDKILVAGIGGGFDIFTALPLIYNRPNQEFILVNSSPKNDFHYRESTTADYPEGFIPARANITAKYTVGRHGVMPVKKAYQEILTKHGINAILTVDGGVDSLMTGDEADPGTILEDFISIAALDEIKAEKVMCYAGFWAETEENVNYFRVLQNMSSAAAKGGFFGSFSLTSGMPEFAEYTKACEAAWDAGRRKSHIQTKIISATNGKLENQYTDVDPQLAFSTGVSYISLLTSVYWFFDFDMIAGQNKAIKTMKNSNTFTDAKLLLRNFLNQTPLRSHNQLPG